MKKKWYWVIGIIILIIFISSIYVFYQRQSLIPELGCIDACCPTAKSAGCSIIITNCSNSNTNDIILDGLHQTKCKFDANKDGKIDNRDTLLELCKNYYSQESDSDCKKLCGC
jgi:hypothetical protein